MTNLTHLKKSLSKNSLSINHLTALKGGGMGNMLRKADKNCPPPVDEGKLKIKSKFL